jgi:hypothetical protein
LPKNWGEGTALRKAEGHKRVVTSRSRATITVIILTLLVTPTVLGAQTIPGAQAESTNALSRGEWPAYAGTYAAARYSPLTQIDRTNANDLHVAWRWKSPDQAVKDANPKVGPTRANESTPRQAKPNGCSIPRSTRTASASPPTTAGCIAASAIGAMAMTNAS